mgnify:CR=1 FL=1
MYPRVLVAALLVVGCGTKSDGGGETSTTSFTSDGDTTFETDSALPKQCLDPNNHLWNGSCECDEGYVRCYDIYNYPPDDPPPLDCCPFGTTGTPPDPTTGTTATTTTESSTDSTTGEPAACDAAPPDGCDPDKETLYCQQGAGCTIEGSVIYWCDAGAWKVDEAATEKQCLGQGEVFAFGCAFEGDKAFVMCGHGPGTACMAEDMSFCTDLTTLQGCQYGKLADTDCVAACMSGAIDGIEHVSGYCMQSRIMPSCTCCDGNDCP